MNKTRKQLESSKMLHVDHPGLLDLISSSAVFLNVAASDKKQALDTLSRLSSRVFHLEKDTVYHGLFQREQLGSTGLGQGIALPHCRLPSLKKVQAAFFRFERPVAFDAPDHAPVDMGVILLAPVQAGADHLQALARCARVLRNPQFCHLLRSAQNESAVIALLARQERDAA